MESEAVMKFRELMLLLLLAGIWGISFLLIRIAAPVVGTVVLVNLRMLIAGVVLFLYATLVQETRPAWRDTWKAFIILGVINAILPLTLEALAVVHLNASVAAILATSTPLFTALIAAVWLDEHLTVRKSLGLAVGLVGVTVLVGWSPLPMTGPRWLPSARHSCHLRSTLPAACMPRRRSATLVRCR